MDEGWGGGGGGGGREVGREEESEGGRGREGKRMLYFHAVYCFTAFE